MNGRPDLVARIEIGDAEVTGWDFVNVPFTYAPRGVQFQEHIVRGRLYSNGFVEVLGVERFELVPPYAAAEWTVFLEPVFARRAIAASLFGYKHYGDPFEFETSLD